MAAKGERDFRTMLRSFCQFSALLLTLASSGFLLRGNLGLGAEQRAELSRFRLDYSPEVLRSLSNQQADTWVGFAMLIAAVFFSLRVSMVAPRIADLGRPDCRGFVLAALFAVGIVGVGWITANEMAERSFRESVTILEESPDRGRTTLESIEERTTKKDAER